MGATRQASLGQADNGLDHFWTKSPEKMSHIYTKFNGSDHKVIFGIRYSNMNERSLIKHFKELEFQFVLPEP